MGLFDNIFNKRKKQNEIHNSDGKVTKKVKNSGEKPVKTHIERTKNKRAEEVNKLVSQLRISKEEEDFIAECYGNTAAKEKNEEEER